MIVRLTQRLFQNELSDFTYIARPGSVHNRRMLRGKWNITIKTPMGDKSGVLELNADGEALTGSLSDGSHHIVISDGKVEGGELALVGQDQRSRCE